MIFLTEDNFCFISDYKNSFSCKLKKLINEQIAIFYSPSNALCSPNESVEIKHFKHYNFIGMFSPWFNLQIMNFCLWRHRVLNRLSKCANVCYRKNQVFLWFIINAQSKLKKFSTLFLRYLPRKTRYSRSHDGLFELELFC